MVTAVIPPLASIDCSNHRDVNIFIMGCVSFLCLLYTGESKMDRVKRIWYL